MKKLVEMNNEFCYVLTQMERAGIRIDRKALNDLEVEFTEELAILKNKLGVLAHSAMGDMPVKLSSGDDLSALLYSRAPYDKKRWKAVFGLGTEMVHGSARKKLPTKMTEYEFKTAVEKHTFIEYKRIGKQCKYCKGTGKVARKRKDGTFGTARFNCTDCNQGVRYRMTDEVAGFNLEIAGVMDVTASGFTTNKDKLKELASTAHGEAKEFLEGMVRYNAVSSYLSNYIGGIKRNVKEDGILHPEFMQCVTKTGRLSSRSPNFQNQPRGGTFPVRRVVVSRWDGGSITDGDYGQLEFRVAAELSGCKVALEAIVEGLDVHAYTAATITAGGQPTTRQDAKAHTFKPLYGGMSGTPAEVAYYKSFLEKYVGIKAWHKHICEQAGNTQKMILPSGRTYKYPFAVADHRGYVAGSTKIKNYPVQGFATADIVPCATIDVYNEMNKRGVKSLLINEVHDSIIVDTYPGEEEIITNILAECMLNIPSAILKRFGYLLNVPMSVEIKQGSNWLDMDTVYEGSNHIEPK